MTLNMAIDGKLTRWNDERGFGFIAPAQGGQDIFIHISAFPRDGRRPQIGELLSFEIELNPEGKKRATSVKRPAPKGFAQSRRQNRLPTVNRSTRGRRSKYVVAFLLLVVAAYGYTKFNQIYSNREVPSHLERPGGFDRPIGQAAPSRFRCDGRIHCSQMTSCTEAKFFLRNCPGVRMDGDHDGVPCEQQWCTSPFAR